MDEHGILDKKLLYIFYAEMNSKKKCPSFLLYNNKEAVESHHDATNSTLTTQKPSHLISNNSKSRTPSPTMPKSWPPPDNNDTPPTSIKRPSLQPSDAIPKKSRRTNDYKPPNTIIVKETKKVDIKRLSKSTSERHVVFGSADALQN